MIKIHQEHISLLLSSRFHNLNEDYLKIKSKRA